MSEFFVLIQYLVLLYFLCLNAVYIALNILSIPQVWHYMKERSLDDLPYVHAGFELPISILAPAYNEELTIAAAARSLLQLAYPEYELIIINDGSKDGTLDVLTREFNLVRFPEAYQVRLQSKPVRAVYYSTSHPNLRVIDKENGGKSDALNAGINLAHYPLYCSMDADSILQRDSLARIARPFLEDPTTVACGGTVRVANGCQVRGGFLVNAGLPNSLLALFQVVEYLRGFLFGRLGWSPLNAVLIISGTFGLFHKDTVVSVGGYRTDTVGEDMELVVRLHRMLRHRDKPFRIIFIPDPICWTEAPEERSVLKAQRIRWQRGLGEALMLNRGLVGRKGGAAGWIAFPFMLVFEFFGPIIEFAGYIFMLLCFVFGEIAPAAWLAFLVLAFGFGTLLSISSLLLEELSFHLYPKLSQIMKLLVVAMVENFGYRQMNSYWRLIGVIRWMRGGKAQWGRMKRKGVAGASDRSNAVPLEEVPATRPA